MTLRASTTLDYFERLKRAPCRLRGWALLAIACAWGLASVPTQTSAQTAAKFPEKAIRFVVPFPPGGGNDILARAIAPRLSEAFGQSVVVDNRAGAGGNIGAEFVAKSAPDGYTILIASNQVTINPWLDNNVPFDMV